MDKIRNIFFLIVFMLPMAFSVSSCVEEDCPGINSPADSEDNMQYNKDENGNYIKERLILIYAVAANNLQINLKYDMDELLQVANGTGGIKKGLNLKNNAVLVYSVENDGKCILRELKPNESGKYELSLVKEFEDLPLSTSPARIADVISFVNQNYDYPNKGLVLWSHADGWLPWFNGSTPDESKRKSFGWDNYQGSTYKTNITALAEAIPDDVFDFIWFDCCYMANVETVYQLRKKTDQIVGSVLEIASDGMPYQLTMPYLLRKDPDLQGAAFSFYSYYDTMNVAVSISIMDCKYLEKLAGSAKQIFAQGTPPVSLSSIQTYQRQLTEKFYDMGQLMKSYTGVSAEIWNDYETAMKETVTYKLISEKDFNYRPINTYDYSGLSMHYFTENGSANNEFYKTLDWYKATRK